MFKEVQDVFKNYEEAVSEKDVEKFLAGYAPNVHLFDCWENGSITESGNGRLP